MSADMEILLGIFTGNHAGAELRLPPGEYVLGAADECDVLLTDSTLAPRHCALTIGADGAARLSPLEGGLSLKGETLSGPLDWQARSPVLAGLVCLAWTRPGLGWTGMTLPSLLGDTPAPDAEAGNAGPEDAKATDTEATAEAAAPGAAATAAAAATEAAANGAQKAEPPQAGADPAPQSGNLAGTRPAAVGKLPGKEKSRARRMALLGAAALLLLALSIGALPPGNGPGSKTSALKAALRAEGFSSLRVEESGGRMAVYGLAPTQEAANKIRNIASRQPHPVQVVLRGEDEFIHAIQAALAGHGLFPQVRLDLKGGADLLGYVQDSLVENAALSWARNAAPPVAEIRSGLLRREAVETVLEAELDKAGLLDKVSVSWRPGVVALAGEEVEKSALSALIAAVRRELDSPVAFQVTRAAEVEKIYVGELPDKRAEEPGQGLGAAAAPDLSARPAYPQAASQGNPFGDGLSLRSVTPPRRSNGTGVELPFITTSDGAVYFIGGTLPSGYVLTGIYTDRLEFSKNGLIMAHKLQGR